MKRIVFLAPALLVLAGCSLVSGSKGGSGSSSEDAKSVAILPGTINDDMMTLDTVDANAAVEAGQAANKSAGGKNGE